MKKRLAIIVLAITIGALWVAPAFAAQGQITEVNPSGIGTSSAPPENTGNDSGTDNAAPPAEDGQANKNGNAGDNGSQGHGGADENDTAGTPDE